MRIEIECAFGALVSHFRVLHRNLQCSTEHAVLLMQVLSKLHNVCIERNLPEHTGRVMSDTYGGNGELLHGGQDLVGGEVAEWRISERYFEPADRNLGSRRRTQDKQQLRTKLRNTLRELQRAEPGSWTRPDRSTCEVYRKRRRPRRP